MDEWEQARPRRRRSLTPLAAVLAALLLTGLIAITETDDGLEVHEEDDLPRPDPSPNAAGVGSWRTLPEAPLAARRAAHAVWTGDELIVWGGTGEGGEPLPDGAAYDPAVDAWRPLPAAPAAALAGPEWPRTASRWTGRLVVVLGTDPPLSYEPASGRWRGLAAPPPGAWEWPSAGWSGREMVVAADADRRAVGYDPDTNTWRLLPDPPVSGWEGAASVPLDGGIALLGAAPADGAPGVAVAVYDDAEDAWRDADPVPHGGAPAPRRRLAGASTMEGWVTLAGGGALPAPALGWSAASGWERLADLPGSPGAWFPAVDAGDGAVLVWDDRAPRAGHVLSPGSPAWEPLAPAPLSPRTLTATAWTGDELVVWGGERGGEPLADGAAFRLDD